MHKRYNRTQHLKQIVIFLLENTNSIDSQIEHFLFFFKTKFKIILIPHLVNLSIIYHI